jgi:probable HAF family extracellular repeat protein
MWVNQMIRDLGTLGNEIEPSIAEDISDTGAVVGRSTASSQGTHAFLWRDGVMRDLGSFGGGSSYAQGVNDHDQVVGVVALPGGPRDNLNRAVLFENGRVVDLNTRAVNLPAGVTLASAFAINNTGVIVGNSCFNPCDPFQSVSRAFMLVPRCLMSITRGGSSRSGLAWLAVEAASPSWRTPAGTRASTR